MKLCYAILIWKLAQKLIATSFYFIWGARVLVHNVLDMHAKSIGVEFGRTDKYFDGAESFVHEKPLLPNKKLTQLTIKCMYVTLNCYGKISSNCKTCSCKCRQDFVFKRRYEKNWVTKHWFSLSFCTPHFNICAFIEPSFNSLMCSIGRGFQFLPWLNSSLDEYQIN